MNRSQKAWKSSADKRKAAFEEGRLAYPLGKNPYYIRTFKSKEFNDGFAFQRGYEDASRFHFPNVPETSPSYNSYLKGWMKRKKETGVALNVWESTLFPVPDLDFSDIIKTMNGDSIDS